MCSRFPASGHTVTSCTPTSGISRMKCVLSIAESTPDMKHGERSSSMVRAPDSWWEGRGFESRQERRENVLLLDQLSVLALISVSIPSPCYHSVSIPSPCYHSVSIPSPCYHSVSIPSPCYHSVSISSPCYHSVSIPSPCYHSVSIPSPCYHSVSIPSPCYHSGT